MALKELRFVSYFFGIEGDLQFLENVGVCHLLITDSQFPRTDYVICNGRRKYHLILVADWTGT